jgi:hypothetical protein
VELSSTVILREGVAMHTFLTCALVLLTILNSTAQVKDVKGWANLRWGMTEKEVKKALGKDAEIEKPEEGDRPYYVGFMVRNIEFDGYKFAAEIQFDRKSKKLAVVNVKAIGNQPVEGQFEALEKALVQKYGQPTYKQGEIEKGWKVMNLERTWNFPSTLIELKCFAVRVGGEGANLVVAIYSDAKSETSLDKF